MVWVWTCHFNSFHKHFDWSQNVYTHFKTVEILLPSAHHTTIQHAKTHDSPLNLDPFWSSLTPKTSPFHNPSTAYSISQLVLFCFLASSQLLSNSLYIQKTQEFLRFWMMTNDHPSVRGFFPRSSWRLGCSWGWQWWRWRRGGAALARHDLLMATRNPARNPVEVGSLSYLNSMGFIHIPGG